ncbi:MAG: heliorhodopsin HeR, partial [Candidatus Limnocylindrales bacterium]
DSEGQPMSAPAAPAISAVSAHAIPTDRSANLFRWNAILAALHLVQAAAILALSFAKSPIVTSPVVGTYLHFDEATRHLVTAQRSIWEMPIGPAVALFFLMSAIAHFAMAFPARRWYEAHLARGQNPIRWIEYAFSSSVMIVVIAALAGVQEVGTLIAIFGANAAMIMFGWSMEIANEGRDRPQWLHYIFGCIAGAVPWLVIFATIVISATEPNSAPIPGFVIAIFVTLFVFFNVFAINMVLQYRKIGAWRDYLYGERAYMLFSLFAKSLLAWQVFFGTLRP